MYWIWTLVTHWGLRLFEIHSVLLSSTQFWLPKGLVETTHMGSDLLNMSISRRFLQRWKKFRQITLSWRQKYMNCHESSRFHVIILLTCQLMIIPQLMWQWPQFLVEKSPSWEAPKLQNWPYFFQWYFCLFLNFFTKKVPFLYRFENDVLMLCLWRILPKAADNIARAMSFMRRAQKRPRPAAAALWPKRGR